jgi:hypothetical protein
MSVQKPVHSPFEVAELQALELEQSISSIFLSPRTSDDWASRLRSFHVGISKSGHR